MGIQTWVKRWKEVKKKKKNKRRMRKREEHFSGEKVSDK